MEICVHMEKDIYILINTVPFNLQFHTKHTPHDFFCKVTIFQLLSELHPRIIPYSNTKL